MAVKKIRQNSQQDIVRSDCPEGWVTTAIDNIVDLNPPKPPQDDLPPEAPVTFVPMPAVDAYHGKIVAPDERPFSAVRKGYTAFRENDVIFAKITPCMENGKSAVVRTLTNGLGFGSTEFHVLRSNGAVIPDYLFYYLRQESFRRAAEAEMTGSVGQKRVPANFLKNAPIPLAPLAEQKRIVTKVEELLARVNMVRERLAKVKEILKRFRQSVLTAACSGRLTKDWRAKHPYLESAQYFIDHVAKKRTREYEAECKKAREGGRRIPREPSNLQPRKVETDGMPELPDGWVWSYLPYLGYMNRGKSQHRPRNAPHLYGGPYPFIQTGDIAQSGGQITSHRQTYCEAGLAQSRLWPAGTVCITIAANIANSAILTYTACFPDSVVGVITDADLCLAEYLEYFIRTARADLDQFAPATSQKNINIAILNDVAVPLPSPSEQQEIVRRVAMLFKLADAIAKQVAAAGERAERLTQAILAKAFRGELVPTEAGLARQEGRSYEPASVLLGRINTQEKDIRIKHKKD